MQDRGLAAYIAELVGTLILTFMICGGVSLYLAAGADPQFGSDFVVIAFVQGLTLFMLIQVLGGVSGAHLNPAVTTAAAMLKRIDPIDAVVYILAQLSGGVLGALLVKGLLLDEGRAANYGAGSVSDLLSSNAAGAVVGAGATASGPVAAPQPTLADLPALIEEVHASGQRLEVVDTLDAASVPLVQQRHLYRIVQECLTNARKHAPRALVRLELSGNRREGITLRCGNDLTDLSAAIPGSKLGLVGITERAQMLGGRLDAGVRGGRFEVEAWLPWETDFRRTP